jgi:Fe-S cluster biogenesis protein NfuA
MEATTPEANETVTISLEWTPNPNTIKLLTNRELLPRGAVNFTSGDAAGASPLAKRLFGIEAVTGVMLGTNFVTLTKSEEGDWIELHRQAVEILTDHLAKKLPIYEGNIEEAYSGDANDSEDVRIIKQILDTDIRPAVAMDGGDITFDRYEDGVLFLHMKGACSGCPSSTATLRMGIEARLRESLPALKEVVSI